MCPRTRSFFLPRSRRFCELLLVLIAAALPVFASATNGVKVRQDVSEPNRQELLRSLRVITGWSELNFDAEGVLRAGNAEPGDGSKTARELLTRTFAGNRVIVFEDASSRKDVVFCRVLLKTLDEISDTAVNIVQIDFADFRQVSGDKQALAAFDVGWAVLHEIDHVVADSQDPQEDVVGDCESHINGMRRELGLPIRNSYFFNYLPVKNVGTLISRFVRMGFDQTAGPSSKRKRYWLIWDAAIVGGLPADEEVTGVSGVNGPSGLLDRVR